MRLTDAANEPFKSFLYALVLAYQPFGFDILPLYIVLLLIMPILLMLRTKSTVEACVVSFSTYLLAQFLSVMSLPAYHGPDDGWLYNPFAWQLLFFIGMVLSTSGEARIGRIAKTWLAVGFSTIAVVAISIFYLRAGGPFVSHEQLPFTEKKTLGPLRLFYFLCLVNVTDLIVPRDWPLWRWKMSQPIIRCGQHSLPVFCFGLLATYFYFALYSQIGLGEAMAAILEGVALLTSIALAYLISLLSNKPRRRSIEYA